MFKAVESSLYKLNAKAEWLNTVDKIDFRMLYLVPFFTGFIERVY